MPGYASHTAPAALRTFLDELIDEVRARLGERLIAVVLHGSLAMGSFYPPKSDIDLLLVISELDEASSAELYRLFERRHERRPYTAGLEMSAVRAADLASPEHPMPFLTHFSSGTKGPQPWKDGMLPVDHDLMAHLMVAKTRGVSLVGPPPAELIGPIAWSDYIASVRGDIDELLSGDVVLQSPRYAVLNFCRWAMMQAGAEQIVPSKEEAAVWALGRIPKAHHPIVAKALDVYRSDEAVGIADLIGAGGPWDEDALRGFRD